MLRLVGVNITLGMECSIHGQDLSNLSVQSSQLIVCPFDFTSSIFHDCNSPRINCYLILTSTPSSVSSYIPSDNESSSRAPLLLLCSVLESPNICTHPRLFVSFPAHLERLRHLSSPLFFNPNSTHIPVEDINFLHK